MTPSNATILVVEDDANDQILMKRAFRKIGVIGPIHFTNNGLDAIAYMKGEGKFSDREQFPIPAFIMTDLKMPFADGFAVLEFLQGHPIWRLIPVVVFTASRDLDDVKKAFLLGANSYHVKPSQPEDLQGQLKLLYDYWMSSEIPPIDASGKQLQTRSEGKLGERFSFH